MKPILIIRAQPGAAETGARAAALGLDCRIVPLFAAQPIAWEAPEPNGFDAIMLTSAHAARHGGGAQAAYGALPCYAVGESTAAAAASAGFSDVRCGSGDGDALLGLMERDQVKQALHLCGRKRRPYSSPDIAITRTIVYAVDGVPSLPAAARSALREDPVVLLHSPRAAGHFATLFDAAALNRHTVTLAAISSAAAEEAGAGWRKVAVAARPRDEPLLTLAARLCRA
jgi:uroporphyrinogen-III synthase